MPSSSSDDEEARKPPARSAAASDDDDGDEARGRQRPGSASRRLRLPQSLRGLSPAMRGGAARKMSFSLGRQRPEAETPSRREMDAWKNDPPPKSSAPRPVAEGEAPAAAPSGRPFKSPQTDDDSDGRPSDDSDGDEARRPVPEAAPSVSAAAKGRQVEIQGIKELLLYLEWEVADGTGPYSRLAAGLDSASLPGDARGPAKGDDGEDAADGSMALAGEVYIESTKTGKFLRFKGGADEGRGARRRRRPKRRKEAHSSAALVALDAELEAVEAELAVDRAGYLERILGAFFMLAQGGLAGFFAALALINYAFRDDDNFVEHYRPMANLFRRWAFLLSTVAFVGALNDRQVAHQDRDAWRAIGALARLELTVQCVLYFVALCTTLVCSVVDVTLGGRHYLTSCQLENFPNNVDDDGPDDDEIWRNAFDAGGITSISTWRFCNWTRFFVAVAGWMLACRRADRIAQQLEQKRREAGALRAAIRAASATIEQDELHDREALRNLAASRKATSDDEAPRARFADSPY
ncbi:hypothetical protein M885DRAFT_613294 [Pelagophyceae sp. CCMP2097]|nr:hypothetical protein M885DRAFT_613294 [Pelagophyceae sp. CCMP2097]|mmetsp:Transcript_30442/g.104676  ORF Transcript_30442/g.104676 Transcript_30442/m.104676 type:complete len:523 (-) Transcript_30442:23-1591(-)